MFLTIRIFGVFGIQSHAMRLYMCICCGLLRTDNSISNVVVSLMIDGMYMYIYLCFGVSMYEYIICVFVCLCVDIHVSTQKMVKQV